MQHRVSRQVAELIRIEMARRAVRSVQLAEKLGVSHTWVYNRVNGRVSPSVDDLDAIARALGMADWRELLQLLPVAS